MTKVVQFGAGNIGRGFTGQLFASAGAEVVFVDVVPEIIAALNERGGYPVELVGPTRHETIQVRGVRAVDGRDREAVAREVAAADLICTAVGVAALPHTTLGLATGLAHRSPDALPLNILLCENQLHIADAVRDLLSNEEVRRWGGEEVKPYEREVTFSPPHPGHLLKPYALVETVVSRMVPILSAEERQRDPLRIVTEDYDHLPLDARAVVGTLPPIPGLEPRDDFPALVERKLFVHNLGHAAAAYHGYLAGKTTIHEAMADPEIAAAVKGAMAEGSAAVTRRHGLPPDEQEAYIADLLRRFANPRLNDTIARVGRDPVRKLRPDDRLIGAGLLALEQGIEPVEIVRAIAAALHFDPPTDAAAVALQTELRAQGLLPVLADRCGLAPDHPLAASIAAALHARG